MKRYKIYLDVSGTIGHIGGDLRGIGVESVNEYAHSDTLFSALIHGLAQSYDKATIDDIFKAFEVYQKEHDENLLPFRCSSAFLSNGKTDFVPRPLCPPPFAKDIHGLNRIRFISWDNLKKWLRIDPMVWNDDNTDLFVDSLFQDSTTYSNLFINRVRAVNAKGRLRNMTQVFHRGEIIYGDNAKLYFWLDVHPSWWSSIQSALNYLKECGGLGGDTSIGFSEIKDYAPKSDTLPGISNPEYYYLLSLLPVSDAVNYQASFYDILNRKSWINSPYIHAQYKKKALKMLKEGSCIKSTNPHGELVNVTPKFWEDLNKESKKDSNWHQIYRYGLGFYIGY